MKHATEMRDECKASQEAKDKVSKLKKEMASFKKSEKAKDKELSSFANALKKPRNKL